MTVYIVVITNAISGIHKHGVDCRVFTNWEQANNLQQALKDSILLIRTVES